MSPSEFELDPSDHNNESLFMVLKPFIGGIASVSLPFFGPAIVDALYTVFGDSSKKRLEKTILTFGHAIIEIQKKQEELTPEVLSKNEEFLTMIGECMRQSLRTHNEEKIQAFKYIAINTALNPDIDESIKLIYLDITVRLTPWHMAILKLSKSPSQALVDAGFPVPEDRIITGTDQKELIVDKLFPNVDISFFNRIVKDLSDEGLLDFNPPELSGKPRYILEPFISEFGKGYFDFISKSIN